jgi:tetratricopeptide (TPR) repeat protein
MNGGAASEARQVAEHETAEFLCPGCGCDAWEGAVGACVRCGLTGADAGALLAPAVQFYEAARAAALAGRYAEARFHAAQAARMGMAGDPALARLDALCCAVLEIPEAARDHYAAAHAAAQRGDWSDAVSLSDSAAEYAPGCLPVLKLRLLCVAGAGRAPKAERERLRLLRAAPEEPDLSRWRFGTAVSVTHRRRSPSFRGVFRGVNAPPRRRSAPVSVTIPATVVGATRMERNDLAVGRSGGAFTPRKTPRNEGRAERWWASALALCALIIAAAALLRPLPVPRVTVMAAPAAPAAAAPVAPVAAVVDVPSRSVPVAATAADALAPDLRREYDASRRTADEQQARRWFNAALTAARDRNWKRAADLAEATYQIGSGTYLAEDALLLAARAADNLHNPLASRAWVRLADERPQSHYAPVALAKAARAAFREGRPEMADAYLNRLRTCYPDAPEARRHSATAAKVVRTIDGDKGILVQGIRNKGDVKP